MRRGIERRLVVALTVMVGCLTVAGVLTFRNSARLRETTAMVTHTYEVLGTLASIRSLLGEAASATRGFAITGQEEYLAPYVGARARIEDRLADLRALTSDNPEQQRRLSDVGALIESQMTYRASLVNTVRGQGGAAAQDLMRAQGGDTIQEVVRRLDALESVERALLAERRTQSQTRDQAALALSMGLTLTVLAALGTSAMLVRHYLAARQRAEAEGSRFFDLSLDLLVISSVDGYFKRLSPAVTSILGWTAVEMQDRPYMDFVHPDDAKATALEVERQVVRGEAVLSFENRYRHKDGGWRTLSWRSVPGEDGLMFATCRDVTEQRRLEHLRSEVDRRFRALFESLPGLYAVLRPDFTVAAASDAYLAAGFKRREDLIGRNLFEAFPDNPEDPKASGVASLRASLERVLATKATDTMPIQKYDVAGPDGGFREKYWSPINSPVLGPNGEVEYIIHRVEDVTEFVLRRRETSSAAALPEREAMERMAAEVFRSAEAARAANIQLRESHAEMEAFSYSVSHDLRAPLRHIQGYAEMLGRETEGQMSEKGVRLLRTISDASHEMGVLIDDLLSFSRMARVGMDSTVVDLDSLAAEVRAGLDRETEGRRIDWRLSALPRVTGDASMLRQVLANLLQNAVKYTRPRDPAVIEMRHVGMDAGQAVFVVSDNGVGFDPQYAHKLFGVFQRLHRVDEFEGTGIGLATVRRVVARHGGRTWAQGNPGEGASVFFTLPMAELAAHETGEGP